MADEGRYKDRTWSLQPRAEQALAAALGGALNAAPEAAAFATRLLDGCAIRLRDILDFIEFEEAAFLQPFLDAGWLERQDGVWLNPSGLFPALVRRPGPVCVNFRVEDADRFRAANMLSGPVVGPADGPARRVHAFGAGAVRFAAFERNGHPGYDTPEVGEAELELARLHGRRLLDRRRSFDTVRAGLAHTEALVDDAVHALGQHRACHLWLRAERAYWMSRCEVARVQLARQDALGVGWCNIDHHTYDGSRAHFRHTIRILEKLGYELREMLYAGELAGWGSQVLEQPVIGSTIFADVDLAPEELEVDFAHTPLPPLPRHRRAGLVCALHGESILQAGLNHVAGLYDQRRLRGQLQGLGFALMQPFSDTPYLYQELTVGETVPVEAARVDRLEAGGDLDPDEARSIRTHGAVLSHLENIERNDGYKGFNRLGIDGVLRKLDPRSEEQRARAPAGR